MDNATMATAQVGCFVALQRRLITVSDPKRSRTAWLDQTARELRRPSRA